MKSTNNNSGSEWRIWDLHIHTPETRKNDQFIGGTPSEKWTNYISEINNSKVSISVVGITDYFSIENYFKFKKYIKDGKITKKFDLVLPNIELRISPVTSKGTPINLHCVFNPKYDTQINTRLLSKLKFSFNGSNYSASESEIIRLGRDFVDKQDLSEKDAYKIGIQQYVVSFERIQEIFESDSELRKNTIIIVSNKSTDGVTGVTKHSDFFLDTGGSQLDATRRSIYQFSDAIFSSNEKDRNYFIGKGVDSVEDVMSKCRSLKPCFHGSDAHNLESIFNPTHQRYCWIKGDPTFIGFKQTLYEPEDRVMIQELEPEYKNPFNIIDSIEFNCEDKDFGNQLVKLNRNLNSIIGGKSAGKSLLLNTIAKSIDPDQVKRMSEKLDFQGYTFSDHFSFKVKWRNNDVDLYDDKDNGFWEEQSDKNHRITYIPQLYINHLAEKNNKNELNDLISSILLQDEKYKISYQEVVDKIRIINQNIDERTRELLDLRNLGLSLNVRQKETGSIESLKNSINSLKQVIEEKQVKSKFSPEEIAKYNELIKKKELNNKNLGDLKSQEIAIVKMIRQIEEMETSLIGTSSEQINLPGKLTKILAEEGITEQPINDIVNEYIGSLIKMGISFKAKLRDIKLIEKKSKITVDNTKIDVDLKPYLNKFVEKNELKPYTERLEKEKSKLVVLNGILDQLERTRENFRNCKNQIQHYINERIRLYEEIIHKVNDEYSDIGKAITLTAKLVYKFNEFKLIQQIDKRSAFSNTDFLKLVTLDEEVIYSEMANFFSRINKIEDKNIVISSGERSQIPLRQIIEIEDVYRGLVEDNFYFDFNLSYKNDELLKMSPGKKGTVLLILFLQISSAEHPILIDQPEDNLDNRTIYELLCSIIRTKKKERQIIIVSHNANLVVSTDSENIIVANQAGQEEAKDNLQTKFEYINGSMENSFNIGDTSISILKQQGIKEHVCDVLEGGDRAFKQRELKYSL